MADYSSSSRKTKTTKRTDRSSRLAERSSQINLSLIEHSDEKSSTGPYQCVGKFSDDFQNLCRQNQISFIPVVLSRPKRAVTPTPTEVTSKEKLKGGQTGGGVTTRRTTQASNLDSLSMTQSDLLMPGVSSSQKQQSIGTLNEHSEDSNKDADGEPLPKSFILVKDRFEYFKPKIHVEYEHPEKSDAILELYIKGWKIDTKIMNIIQQCLLRSEKLVTLNLWCCGLNEETIDILAGFLPKCSNLKNVSLDGNPTIEENYHKLISSDSIIQSLSLRNCQITDSGAQKLGYALGNIYSQNKKLLILNLSTNYIGDKGAIELANGLRTNRTLLVLNLSSNQIGDIGAKYFAETLSRFKMTHEEIVKRRMLKREQIFKDNPTILRKTKQDTFDRPQSIAQNKTPKESTIGRVSKKENLSNTRDRSKSKDQNNKDSTINEKQSGSKMKSKEKESNPSVLGTSTLKKDKSGRETKMDGSATSDKVAKSVKNKNSKTKLRDSDTENELRSTSGGKISSINQMYTEIDPLMDETEAVEGDLWLSGNRTLIALNLSRNRITSKGVKEFLLCIQYQLSIHLFNKSAFANGLLKLNLNKNAFQSNDENYVKFTELLKTRDPIANKANEEKDTISVISKEGKETSRSKSGKNLMKNLA